MLDEFYQNYKDIIDRYERKTKPMIKKQISRFNGNFFEKLLMEVALCYCNQAEDSNDRNVSQYLSEIYQYENILDNILLEAFKKKIKTLTSKDELLEKTLGETYNDAYIYIVNGKYVDSDVRKKSLELYQEVIQKNQTMLHEKTKDKMMVLTYGIFDVHVLKNNKHDMSIIVYLSDGSFSVHQVDLDDDSVVISKEKNTICKLIERYLNKHQSELINNPKSIITLFNKINLVVPEIAISKNNLGLDGKDYKRK